MKSSDELFQLIRSMSKPEKRHFKLFANRNTKKGSNNYIKLFDALDNQSAYDHDKIVKRFKNETFVNHLSSTKYQLFNLILRSLSDYNTGKTIDTELSELMNNVRVLYNRGLYDSCKKLIDKVKKIAANNDKHFIALEVLHLERKMLFRSQKKNLERDFETIVNYEKSILAKITNEATLSHLQTRVAVLRKVQPREGQAPDIKELHTILQHPLLRDDSRAITLSAKLDYYRTHANAAIIAGNLPAIHKYQKKLISVWDVHPRAIKTSATRYKTDLANYLTSCISVHKYDGFEEALRKIKSLPTFSLDDEVRAFQDILYIELTYYLNTGQYQQGKSIVGEIESGINRYRDQISNARLMTFYYNITILHFVSAEYRETLVWLEKILSLPQDVLRQDILECAQILAVVVHFELGNSDALESTLRSAYRRLLRKNKLQLFQKRFFFYMNKIVSATDRGSLLQMLKAMRKDLLTIAEQETLRKVIGFTEILVWLESKLEGVTITELTHRRIAERELEKA